MHGSTPTGTTQGDAVFVNAWVVTDGCQEEFVEAIDGLFKRARQLDGFLEGELLRGVNPTRFVSYARMRSERDRQRLLDDREFSARLQTAGQIARSDLHSYEVLRAYGGLAARRRTT